MGLANEPAVENYEVLSLIEKSKAGITYKVRNRSTGEVEAMRTLPGRTSADPESIERLLREVRIQARLAHPNVTAFHDAFEVEGQLVMTTEFVDGRSLADLCREGPLDHKAAVEIVLHLLDGLDEAHSLGIVHRGITAEHVVFGQDGVVKLGGFGLAKPASDTSLTRVGTVMGDPKYISPEQITEHGAVDARSDLYSMGVLLYQVLTGKLPFSGSNDFEVMRAQVIAEPARPSSVCHAIPVELDAVVLKTLRKNPAERYQNARELRAALHSAIQPTAPAALPATAEPEIVSPPAPITQVPRKWFRPGLAWASAAGVVGLAAVFWFLVH